MTTLHALTKQLARAAGLLAVIALGLFGIAGSGSDGDGDSNSGNGGGSSTPGTLGVFYGVNPPDFLAYRVGLDGDWTKATPSGLSLNLDVGVAADFAFIATCFQDSIRRAYYFDTSTSDISNIRLDCDDTDVDTTYTLSGIRSGPGSFAPTAFYLGREADVTLDLNYSLDFALDADDTGPKDIVASTPVGGLLHYKFWRGVSLQPSVTWDFAIEPTDTGESVTYDVSAQRLDPDYLSTEFRLYTANGTRAELDGNSTDDTVVFQKAPAGFRIGSDVYRVGARFQGLDNWRYYARWSIDPQGATLGQVPNEVGTVTGTAGGVGDAFAWEVAPSVGYDFGIGGMAVQYMDVRAESTVPSEGDIPIQWRLYKTASPLASGLSLQLERGFTDLAGWNDDWMVNLPQVTKVGLVGSNGTVQQTLDARFNPSSDLDGLNTARSYSLGVQLNF